MWAPVPSCRCRIGVHAAVVDVERDPVEFVPVGGAVVGAERHFTARREDGADERPDVRPAFVARSERFACGNYERHDRPRGVRCAGGGERVRPTPRSPLRSPRPAPRHSDGAALWATAGPTLRRRLRAWRPVRERCGGSVRSLRTHRPQPAAGRRPGDARNREGGPSMPRAPCSERCGSGQGLWDRSPSYSLGYENARKSRGWVGVSALPVDVDRVRFRLASQPGEECFDFDLVEGSVQPIAEAGGHPCVNPVLNRSV